GGKTGYLAALTLANDPVLWGRLDLHGAASKSFDDGCLYEGCEPLCNYKKLEKFLETITRPIAAALSCQNRPSSARRTLQQILGFQVSCSKGRAQSTRSRRSPYPLLQTDSQLSIGRPCAAHQFSSQF